MNRKDVLKSAANVARRVWKSLSNNLGLKLLSVVFALFVWSYVVSSSPTITREKTLSSVDITVSGQTVLSGRGLALLTDVSELGGARVRVKVTQSNFSQVSTDNVRVELDLSSIRQTGKQSIKLRGSSTYGSVVEVWPQYVDLEVENQDQRYVPVNAQITGGQQDGYWYSVSRLNPSQITVTGPTSLVQNVSSALVSLDMTGRTEPHNRVEACVLLDASGQEVSQSLSKSTSSVNVAVDVYPTRSIPVTQDREELITGQLPDGYQVTGVEVSPETLVVAGEASLLDTLSELSIQPVSVEGRTQTYTVLADINTVKGVKHLSAEEVSVTVTIEEQTLSKRLSDVPVDLTGLPDGMTAAASPLKCDVRVSGPYSIVRALSRNDVTARVNLEGLEAGTHTLPVEVTADNYPDLSCEATPVAVRVTLAPISGADS